MKLFREEEAELLLLQNLIYTNACLEQKLVTKNTYCPAR